MPASPGSGSVERERDAWVQAIDKLCSEWKRKSMGEQVFVGLQTFRNISIEEEEEEEEGKEEEVKGPDLESSGGLGGGLQPPLRPEAADEQISPGPSSAAGTEPPGAKPVPAPRRKMSAPDVGPAVPTPVRPSSLPPSPTCPQPSPTPAPSTSSTSTQQAPKQESRGAAALVPLAPAPPPLPMRQNSRPKKKHTRPFHWDVVTPDKVTPVTPTKV